MLMYTCLREVLYWQEEASGNSGDHFLTRAALRAESLPLPPRSRSGDLILDTRPVLGLLFLEVEDF
jgi:hypothetical protein